jgi:hypothetical protein
MNFVKKKSPLLGSRYTRAGTEYTRPFLIWLKKAKACGAADLGNRM